MKTKFALAFYYLAIGFLVACTVTIVVKLIFWPPCTQSGNLCVIDGWSVAGLAGTVLGVAATVLAILGAVAVAAWWTSLNERVSNQVTALVTKFYDEQKAETIAHLEELNKMFQPLELQAKHFNDVTHEMNQLREMQTKYFNEEMHEMSQLREALTQDLQSLATYKSRVERLTEQLGQAQKASEVLLQQLRVKETEKHISEEKQRQNET